MAALSTGYWLGGALADRWPRRSGVGVVIAIAGILVTLIPVVAPLVFAIAGDALRRGSLVAAMGLFFLPTTLMGAVSPYAIRLQEFTAGQLGRTAGRLYAISTVGSILGTLVTAFWLIPFAGVAMLVVSLGVALLILASVTFASALAEEAMNRSMALVSVAIAITLASVVAATGRASVAEALFGERPGMKLLIEKDSLYHHIRVSDAGGFRYLMFDKNMQTSMRIGNPVVTGFAYPNYFHLARIIRPQTRNVLLIGLGGGTTPHQFLSAYPDVTVDAVEIDDDVAKIAMKWFALPPESNRFHVYVEDGRRFLTRSTKKYDLIIIDAFHVDSMPFHLFTQQFFAVCHDHLNQDGLVAINIISAMEGKKSGITSSIYKTIGTVFPERYLFPIDFHLRKVPNSRRNIILIAGGGVALTQEELRAAAIRSSLPQYAQLVADFTTRQPDMKYAKLLSDDYAPVDDLLMFE